MIQYIIEQIEDKYDTYLSEDEIALVYETMNIVTKIDLKRAASGSKKNAGKNVKPPREYSKNWLVRNLIQRPYMEHPISTTALTAAGILGADYLNEKYAKNNDQNTDTRNPKNSKI